MIDFKLQGLLFNLLVGSFNFQRSFIVIVNFEKQSYSCNHRSSSSGTRTFINCSVALMPCFSKFPARPCKLIDEETNKFTDVSCIRFPYCSLNLRVTTLFWTLCLLLLLELKFVIFLSFKCLNMIQNVDNRILILPRILQLFDLMPENNRKVMKERKN